MKLCFGTFANVLLHCGAGSIKKLQLVNTLVKSVDADCELPSSAVTLLLRGTANLPDGGRSNGRGDVANKARDADPQKVAQYFAKRVVPLLDQRMHRLAVLALREICLSDNSIHGDAVVEPISGATINALPRQSKFVLSEFLAGVFRLAVAVDNRVGKDAEVAKAYVDAFEDQQDSISLVAPQSEIAVVGTSADAFAHYLAEARTVVSQVKTLLYKDEPMPIYDFYIPNRVGKSAGRERNTPIDNVDAAKILKMSNFIIIDGVGGLGKTMMMRHLAVNAIDGYKTLRRVPIFAALKDYTEFDGELFDFVYSKLTAFSANIALDDYMATLSEGAFLLLFDGLDEIDSRQSGRFERELSALTDKYPKNHFVISSRPYQNFVPFSRFTVLKIMPFTPEQSIALIDKLKFRTDEPQIKIKFAARGTACHNPPFVRARCC